MSLDHRWVSWVADSRTECGEGALEVVARGDLKTHSNTEDGIYWTVLSLEKGGCFMSHSEEPRLAMIC